MNGFRTRFSADANDYILQARTWQKHDVGTTPASTALSGKALRSIEFPSSICLRKRIFTSRSTTRYEQAFIPHVTFMPIPSLWGHTAGAASSPADAKF